MRKIVKSTLAVASAVAMTVSLFASVPTTAKATDLSKSKAVYDPAVLADGETYYTLTGGVTSWDPLAESNTMSVTDIAGVYSMEINVGAYDAAAEWNNRFKICQIDNTVYGDGWDHSILLGTGLYGDNETQFRIENAEAGTFTVYFKPATGAVIVKDANGELVDYTISWAGYEKAAPIIAANNENFITCEAAEASKLEDWETDKIPASVTAVPAFTKINAALADEVANFVPDAMADGEVAYTLAGGVTSWTPLARSNKMTETEVAGVYAMEINVGAYDAAAEWNNRFKICQIDNTVYGDGWDHSILLGTGLYGDNETQFRIENAEAGTFTVYFKPATGAVIVKDANGELVDYTISWAGYEKAAPIIAANNENFITCEAAEASKLEDWETDKIPTSVTAVPAFTKINAALAEEIANFIPDAMADGEVVYTLAGGVTSWTPLARSNKMTETRYDGVYAMEISVGAYDAAAEWNNRFKICQIDNTVYGDGWDHSILLGTGLYGDNETQFRIENAEAGTFTVYFDSKTGAVVIQNEAGELVDYTISWAGYEKAAPIIAANNENFITCADAEASKLEDWETDKIPASVTEVPKFTEINAALAEKLSKVPSAVSPVEPQPVEVTLAIKASTKTIYTGKASNTAKIKATVTGTDEKVTFKSSNKKIAKVSSAGKVTAVKAGKVTITAKVAGVSKKVKITVKNPTITVKSGSKKVTKVTVKKGKTAKLVVTTNPKKATSKVTYADKASKKVVKLTSKSASTKNTVTVKGLKKGTAKIKVTSGGATKTIKVTVK